MEDAAGSHRVAVTVFVEAAGVDVSDAANHAAMAVRNALAGGVQLRPLPYDLPPVRHADLGDLDPVTVHFVAETGAAGGNGYLRLTPTSLAYPSRAADPRRG